MNDTTITNNVNTQDTQNAQEETTMNYTTYLLNAVRTNKRPNTNGYATNAQIAEHVGLSRKTNRATLIKALEAMAEQEKSTESSAKIIMNDGMGVKATWQEYLVAALGGNSVVKKVIECKEYTDEYGCYHPAGEKKEKVLPLFFKDKNGYFVCSGKDMQAWIHGWVDRNGDKFGGISFDDAVAVINDYTSSTKGYAMYSMTPAVVWCYVDIYTRHYGKAPERMFPHNFFINFYKAGKLWRNDTDVFGTPFSKTVTWWKEFTGYEKRLAAYLDKKDNDKTGKADTGAHAPLADDKTDSTVPETDEKGNYSPV